MNIEIEYDLSGNAAPDYGMYSDIGNAAVHAIVLAAQSNKMTWVQTLRALRALAEQEQFDEAMDTMVREMVYSALGVEDEPFYV
jgi:leucyl aminopeptidase (aminopeptidase T)